MSQIVNERLGGGSGSVAEVVLEHPTEALAAAQLACNRANLTIRGDEVVANALMVSLRTVVRGMFREGATE